MSLARLNDQEIRKFWEAKLKEVGRDFVVDFSIGDTCLKI